jgi:outer membrane protein OmpA-like peptidoglycan-associated protein
MKQLTIHAFFLASFFALTPIFLLAQDKTTSNDSPLSIEGTIKNELNGNPLPDAQIVVFDDRMFAALAQTTTDGDGHYRVVVPRKDRYRVAVDKNTYFKADKIFVVDSASQPQNINLRNKPGYIFDVTIFDKDRKEEAANTLPDCKIEIYNNTTKEQELTLPKHPKAVFNFPFNEGNHYTILVRKPHYINRRIEAFVDINGCIMCVDGMGVEKLNMIALMSHNNEIGYFLGNVDLDSIQIGKKFMIPNIYYDYDKSFIRPEAAKILDKLAVFLKDNPAIKVELGAHTDSRGSDTYNMALSGRRAESAVKYLVERCGVSQANITWKGYGETELVNSCSNKVKCSESDHQLNRRTELKVTAIMEEDPLWNHSLKEIIEDKNLYYKIIKMEKSGQGQPKTGSPSTMK